MAEPLCEYFGNCGGCSLQHTDYSTQLMYKKNALIKAVGKYFEAEKIKVFSGNEYYYRNRMDLIFTRTGIGFRKKNKWDTIIDIQKCVIANERLNSLITEIRNYFKNPDYFDIKKKSGTFMYAIIRAPTIDSSISFVLNSESARISEAVEKIKLFSQNTSAKNVVVTYVMPENGNAVSEDYFVVKGCDMLRETYMGKEFVFSLQGFFQNNSEMAGKMHEYVHGIIKDYGIKQKDNIKSDNPAMKDKYKYGAYLLDLYGGVGTFGIINAEFFKKVTIVENYKGSIESAKENIKNNNITNAEAIVLDAKNLKKINLNQPLYVINDPPRSGMHIKAAQELNNLKPKVIIYISCNALELGKDLPKFKDYQVKSIALFDLFPQTLHSEAIVELERKKE